MRPILFPLLLLIGLQAEAQSPLDGYIRQAMESNIALKQQNLSYQKSLAALEEARALFFPKVSIEARYSRASGGRTIDIPVGDLLNPVYDNLNRINEITSPGAAAYPQIDNSRTYFLRSSEHETALRLAFPIFNSAILNNHRIQQDLSAAEQLSVEVYKRELVKEVKSAYYNYGKAVQAVLLFENTLLLVNENLRTTESLHKYDKVTVDVVYAAEVEVKRVEQQLAEAQRDAANAHAYFNFLLNRSFEEPVTLEASETLMKQVPLASVNEVIPQAQHRREELRQLDRYLSASASSVRLSKGENLPQLNLVADYGFQGTGYSFTSEDDYMIGSVVMSWPLFNKPTSAKVQQARIERQILSERKTETSRMIGLQIINAYHDLQAASKSIELSQKEVTSANKAYRLVEKKFRQGQANLVELTNARTQKTNAEFGLIINQYDYLAKAATYERAAGSYNL
ncbi:MAG: TolC family protein [Bacteroidota bacterium]